MQKIKYYAGFGGFVFFIVFVLLLTISLSSAFDSGSGAAISGVNGSFSGVIESINEPAVKFAGNTITGMTYYAPGSVVNVPLYCGDTVCNNGETCSSCAEDCGSCPVPPSLPPKQPGGGGGPSGGMLPPCNPEYVCGSWSACQSNNIQLRTCSDSKKCVFSKDIVENQSCIFLVNKTTESLNESASEDIIPEINDTGYYFLNVTNISKVLDKKSDSLEINNYKSKVSQNNVRYAPSTLSLLLILLLVVLLFAIFIPLIYIRRNKKDEESFKDYLNNPNTNVLDLTVQQKIMHHMEYLIDEIQKEKNVHWQKAYDLYDELVFCHGKLTEESKKILPPKFDFDMMKYNLMFVQKNQGEQQKVTI